VTPIQPILIGGILCVAVVCAVSLRSQVFARFLAVGTMLFGVVFVLYPDFANRLANLLGVGRGADLFFYIFSVLATYGMLMLYVRTRTLERQLTDVVRHIAIAEAKAPDGDVRRS
jgi:hypothetical protein